MDKIILSKIKKYVGEIFKQKKAENKYYHNFTHTAEVVKVTEEISNSLGVSDDEKEILLIAAWFHDVGYIERCNGHEDLGVEIATNFLKVNGYEEDKINRVASLIKSTKLPRNPQNLLEEIICDADLFHLGTDEFDEKEKLFRKELEAYEGGKINDKAWLEKNFSFFAQHKFYTNYAKEKFETKKKENLIRIQERLKRVENNSN